MAEAHRPITHETARAQRQHSRAEVARSAGQEQEPGVVGEQMQPVKLHRVVLVAVRNRGKMANTRYWG